MKREKGLCLFSINEVAEDEPSVRGVRRLGIESHWASSLRVSGIEKHLAALAAINRARLHCDLTIKLHDLGIYQDEGIDRRSADRIVSEAARTEHFVWIDMERPDTVDVTIRIFRALYDTYGSHCGICLQAYFSRTKRDAEELLRNRAPIRLVKGF